MGVTVAAGAIILSVQLLVPPIVGLANNADFEKVMGYVGLQYLTDSYEDRYFLWVLTKFAIVEPGWYRSGYHTSETLLAGIARLVAEPFAKDRVFDIRFLGALHILLLLLAISTIVSACRDLARATQWLVAFLLVFFFTDVGYAALFNSLYSQTASFLFLALTAAVATAAIRHGRLDGWLLVAYFLCALLFVGSKPQYGVLGPLMAAFALRLARVRAGRWWLQPAVWLALALCGFSIVYFRRTPPSIRQVALYHTVFSELLPHSPDPARDLDELGLDAELLNYSGTTAYVANTPIWDPRFQARFFGKFGYPDLLRFYLTHPARLTSVVRRGAAQAFRLRPVGFGNFEKASGAPARATATRFAGWSDLRLKLSRHALLALTILFGGSLLTAAAGYRGASRRGRLFREGIAVLVFMAGVEFFVCLLADAHLELVRHLSVFEAFCDLILIADAAWLAQAVAVRLRPEPTPAETPAA